MLTGDNGILNRAAEAKENTEQSQLEEQKRLASMEAATNLTETVYNDGEKEIKIPSGYAPTGIEGENTVEKGLVITDSKGNEFVWVEVPNDGTGPNYTAVASEEEDSDNYYTAIAGALRTYCTKDASGEELIKDGTSSEGTYGKTSTYGYKDVWDLTMFQFMDAVQRARLIDSTNHLLNGVYAGTIDSKKIKNEKFNWMREIREE